MEDESYVGLFFYVDGNVYTHKWNFSHAERDYFGMIGAPNYYSHTDLYFELKEYPYLLKNYHEIVLGGVDKYRNYFLRGRVVYDTRSKKFHILSNHYIAKNNGIIKKICEAFNIDFNNTVVDCYSTYEIYDRRFEV